MGCNTTQRQMSEKVVEYKGRGEKQGHECRSLSCPFHSEIKIVCDDLPDQRAKRIPAQRICAALRTCRDHLENMSNLFRTRAGSGISDEGVFDRTPVWFPDIPTSTQPRSCGTKGWKMEVIHVSSALNNNINPASGVEKAFLLACWLCFVPLLKLFAATI